MAVSPAKDTSNGANVIMWTPNHEILMVRHTYGSRRWALPGGGIQESETAVQACLRELFEETGISPQCDMKLVALLAQRTKITGAMQYGLLALYSTPSLYKGTIAPDAGEVSEVRFMTLREIFCGPELVGLGYKRMIAIWKRQLHTTCVHDGALSTQVSIFLDGQVLYI